MVWIRALRIARHQDCLAKGISRGVTTWTGLGRALLAGFGEVASQGRLQGVLGVVNRGNDPRRLIRRIPVGELETLLPEGGETVRRRVSGRAVAGEGSDAAMPYLQIPTDLVEAGEKLCPGSSHWENAYLWMLSYPVQPKLDDVRAAISYLKYRLRLCTLPPNVSASHDDVWPFADSGLVDRYAASLRPLALSASADSLSLLGALVAESHITRQDTLLELHLEYFRQGVETLLAHPLMSDIAKTFREWVADPILDTHWELPEDYHASSLSSPLISMRERQQITGDTDFDLFFLDVLGVEMAPPPWH